MQQVQLYIKNEGSTSYELLDTFKDETISLTQSVKNIKDLAKILTDFTQSFTVPASKTNNRIFKHYYESYLSDGLDARFLIDAKINLNGVDFKDGKMRLLGVKMKNGKPSAYNISFVGNTVSLKTLFGDDELSDLPFMANFNHEYTYDKVREYMTIGHNPVDFVSGSVTSKATNAIIDANQDFSQYYPDIESGIKIKNTNPSSPWFGNETTIGEQETDTKITVDDNSIFNVGDTYSIESLSVFGDGFSFPEMIYPFIGSSKNRYYYNSGHTSEGDHDEIDNVRNIYHNGVPNTTSNHSNYHSIQYFDLKPAVKVHYILKAIENKYGFVFSDDFFRQLETSSGKPNVDGLFQNLYMWCNREAGSFVELIGEKSEELKLEELTFTSGNDIREESGTSFTATYNQSIEGYYSWKKLLYSVTFSVTGSGIYDMEIYDIDTSEVYATYPNLDSADGSKSVFVVLEAPTGVGSFSKKLKPSLRIKTKESVSAFSASFLLQSNIRYSDNTTSTITGYYSGSKNVSNTIDFKQKILPKIKVFDFLTGLFKMFNLIAYFEGGQLIVKTLNQYYLESNNVTYNIDEYVDIESYKIDRGDIYREINYEFKKANTVFAIESNEKTGDEYGNEKFKSEGDKTFDGKKYDIKVKFGHMLYENMVDQEDQTFSGVTWGYSVSRDFNPVIDGGSLFCVKRLSGSDMPSDVHVTDKPDGDDHGTTAYELDSLYTPSNTYEGASVGVRSINFGSEFDERTNQVENDSLFEVHHKNYILNLYQADSRIVKITAHLPLSILLKYELNDRFIFRGKKYLINSVKTNLQTGKSDIELLSDNYGEE